MKRLVMLTALGLAVSPRAAGGDETGYGTEPEITVAAPLGARRGAALDVDVQGRGLAGVYAASFPCDDVRAVVRGVEEIAPEPPSPNAGGKPRAADPKRPEYRVRLGVEVASGAALGLHTFRLVTPRGAPNPLALQS